jgi:hypothetical protein
MSAVVDHVGVPGYRTWWGNVVDTASRPAAQHQERMT